MYFWGVSRALCFLFLGVVSEYALPSTCFYCYQYIFGVLESWSAWSCFTWNIAVKSLTHIYWTALFYEVTEKGVIPVLDAGIHLRKSLCCKEIDYRDKPDNDNFRSFSATFSYEASFFIPNYRTSISIGGRCFPWKSCKEGQETTRCSSLQRDG